MSDLSVNIRQQRLCQGRKRQTSNVILLQRCHGSLHDAALPTTTWRLTACPERSRRVLRMTRVGINGQHCFARRFLAVARIVTNKKAPPGSRLPGRAPSAGEDPSCLVRPQRQRSRQRWRYATPLPFTVDDAFYEEAFIASYLKSSGIIIFLSG